MRRCHCFENCITNWLYFRVLWSKSKGGDKGIYTNYGIAKMCGMGGTYESSFEVSHRTLFSFFFSFNGHNIVSQCVYQNLISTAFFRWHWNIKGVQLYWNRASAWVFSRKFAAYFQNTFSYKHVRRTASAAMSTSFLENNPNLYFLIGFYENNFPTFFFLFLTEHKFRSNIIILIL